MLCCIVDEIQKAIIFAFPLLKFMLSVPLLMLLFNSGSKSFCTSSLSGAAWSTVHTQVFESSICIVEEQFDMLLDCQLRLASDSWIRIKSCVA